MIELSREVGEREADRTSIGRRSGAKVRIDTTEACKSVSNQPCSVGSIAVLVSEILTLHQKRLRKAKTPCYMQQKGITCTPPPPWSPFVFSSVCSSRHDSSSSLARSSCAPSSFRFASVPSDLRDFMRIVHPFKPNAPAPKN